MGVEGLLTSAEVAEWLRVEVQTLANWRSENRGPDYVSYGQSRVMYERADVQKWIDGKKVKAGGY